MREKDATAKHCETRRLAHGETAIVQHRDHPLSQDGPRSWVALTFVAADSYPVRPKSEEEGNPARMPTTLDSYQRKFCLAPVDANLRLLAP